MSGRSDGQGTSPALERGRLEARWTRLQLLLLTNGQRGLVAELGAPEPAEQEGGAAGGAHEEEDSPP
jgi:hypothetical protein